jgi:hypothetical protein
MLAAMNNVSDLNLAVAASKAGIFPSISGFNYGPAGKLNLNVIKNDLENFNNQTGTNNLILSVGLLDILSDQFIEDICTKKLFSHIEVVDDSKYLLEAADTNNIEKLDAFFYYSNQLKLLEIKLLFKILSPHQWIKRSESVKNIFSGAILKSSDASGSVITKNRDSLKDEFKYLKNFSSDKVFVPTGGISTKEQVKEFINLGAEIVGIGAYFVSAKECSVSLEVKKKLLISQSNDIKRFDNSSHNALIFSNVTDDDANHTKSLKAGLSNPNTGHIYMSKSIENIKEIKPLKDLVDDLIDN